MTSTMATAEVRAVGQMALKSSMLVLFSSRTIVTVAKLVRTKVATAAGHDRWTDLA